MRIYLYHKMEKR